MYRSLCFRKNSIHESDCSVWLVQGTDKGISLQPIGIRFDLMTMSQQVSQFRKAGRIPFGRAVKECHQQ